MFLVQDFTVWARDGVKCLPTSDGSCPVSCLVYLDDIIVFPRDLCTHLNRLAEVFERLKQAGLKLHSTNVASFRDEFFLGMYCQEMD